MDDEELKERNVIDIMQCHQSHLRRGYAVLSGEVEYIFCDVVNTERLRKCSTPTLNGDYSLMNSNNEKDERGDNEEQTHGIE